MKSSIDQAGIATTPAFAAAATAPVASAFAATATASAVQSPAAAPTAPATSNTAAATSSPTATAPTVAGSVARARRRATSTSPDPRAPYRSHTIVGRNRTLSTDSFETGINNNMLVIGPSGSGKTRNVLKPNLLQMGSSFIVLDTKGMLCREVGPLLAHHGYEVQCLDFTNLSEEPLPLPLGIERVGYDPLAFIRTATHAGKQGPNQQDIISVARALCPIESEKDPFWDRAASNLIACLIAYVMEELPPSERHFGSVVALAEHLDDQATFKLLDDLGTTDPASLAHTLYLRYAGTLGADKMSASINGIVAEKLMCLGFDGALALYTAQCKVTFERMGTHRMALFVAVSDLDRSLDPLTSLFVDQAFKALVRTADRQPGGMLPVPVRLLLDDFANLHIEQADNMLSVARSREIWCTLLLQSVNQLDAIYGHARALSLMSNCDTQLVLAFQDIETARCYSDRANKLPATLLEMPRSHAMLFVAGKRCEEVEKYRLEEHPLYQESVEVAERAAYHGRLADLAGRAARAAADGVMPATGGAMPAAKGGQPAASATRPGADTAQPTAHATPSSAIGSPEQSERYVLHLEDLPAAK